MWRHERLSWTSVNATSARSATVGRGHIGGQFKRSDDDAEKQPRADLLIDQASVFPEPADSGVSREHTFQDRTSVNV